MILVYFILMYDRDFGLKALEVAIQYCTLLFIQLYNITILLVLCQIISI